MNGLLEAYRFQTGSDLLAYCIQTWERLKKKSIERACLADWIQFNGNLFELSGDIRYIEEIEMITYNTLLGSLKLWKTDKKAP